jgi:hypothetical protein
MFKKAIPMAVAATLIFGMAGCSNNNKGGGGGGTTTTTPHEQAKTNEQNQAHTPSGNKLSSQGKDFADAYSRVAWVHADIMAKDWDQAKDDLKHVDSKLNDLMKDNALSANAKTAIKGLKSDVSKLNTSIQKHDAIAAVQAKALLNRFATDLNMAPTMAWFNQNKGGGAGTGVKNTVTHPVKTMEHKTNEMKK